jgi:phospholipid/cholesterol/gamma-HCH transport system ATP-binding protein
MLEQLSDVLSVTELKNSYGGVCVHEQVSFTVSAAEIVTLVGKSGCGKTTLVNSILSLKQIDEGSVELFGQDISSMNAEDLRVVMKRIGVMFQQGALFGSMTVLENIMFPALQAGIPKSDATLLGYSKMKMVGLALDAAHKYPSEISGGMTKRVAIARSIMLDPALLFLDEPTSGLDPCSASGINQMILDLRRILGLSVIIITHDVEVLRSVADKVLFMAEGKLIAALPYQELIKYNHPAVEEYFSA